VLLRVSEQRNTLHQIRKWNVNWIGHILRRNCLLKQVIEGKIKWQVEVTRTRGGRRMKLLDDLGDRRGYCHLEEEALGRIKWRNCFAKGFRAVSWLLMMMMMYPPQPFWGSPDKNHNLLHVTHEQCHQMQSNNHWSTQLYTIYLWFQHLGTASHILHKTTSNPAISI
jgi:hypothetical protein